MKKQVINAIDFSITGKCNYSCPYCDQGTDKTKFQSASDSVIDSFINLLKTNQFKSWGIVQLVGGEPTIHKRFWDLINAILSTGNKVQICTNFSQSFEFYERLINISGDNLHRVQISFHPTQVIDIEDFIRKVFKVNEIKHKNTIFIISSVLTEANFEQIKYLQSRLIIQGLKVELQHQRTLDQKFVNYSPEMAEYIKKESGIEYLEFSKNATSFGLKCHAGINFFTVDVLGNACRCYGDNIYLGFLGNIKDNTFSRYRAQIPCLSEKCSCALAAQHGMIDFDHKNTNLANFLASIKHKRLKKVIRLLLGMKINA